MYNKILFIGLVFITLTAKAHQADVSTTMLVERENNTWVLQISSSLTAFQQEIQTNFSETPYRTPEEFQQMVLEHIKNNVHIRFNGKDITFGKGVVKLGHETKVVFEVFGIPSEIKSAHIENTAFKDISRSQSAIFLLKEGFIKKQFVLNEANNHKLILYVEGNTFKIFDSTKSDNRNASYFGWIFGGVFLLVMALMAISNMFKPEKIELRPIR